MMWALSKGGGSSTGPDNVGYPLLQRLPFSIKISLLELFNHAWDSGTFSNQWKEGIVVPIPKPEGDRCSPAGYRPITLLSCIDKLFERLVNRRLTTELEQNGRLDGRQHAFRPGRGVESHLAHMESLINLNENQHAEIVSLDTSKAYDTTWRPAILQTLTSWKISGRMLHIISSILSNRTFRVSANGASSIRCVAENGVPQGSILSVTLFLVAMEPIFKIIPIDVEILLYADDVLLVAKGSSSGQIRRHLRKAVKAVVEWAGSVGFEIAPTKSKLLHICNIRHRKRGLTSSNDETMERVLAPTYNEVIRQSSGAFRSSPVQSIMAEAGCLPFRLMLVQRLSQMVARLTEKDPNVANYPVAKRSVELFHQTTGSLPPRACNLQRLTDRGWYSTIPKIDDELKRNIKAAALIERALVERNITLSWIPGHARISGNEEADRLANQGGIVDPMDIPIPSQDVVRLVKQKLWNVWQRDWDRTQSLLREVKPYVTKSTDRKCASEQRILTRLRIGHTIFSHAYLMEVNTPPTCCYCGVPMTVKHVLVDCRGYAQARQQYNKSSRLHDHTVLPFIPCPISNDTNATTVVNCQK
ncbi:uncharacterized protein LOC131687580 [Topomyia yanbarensis]|uniref:uncharacterized protein LOC131687580 n=1 Tax=Topomyia yanbarensis TaxID=2498891 RepID=UPI00273CE9B7|nr:uncharacterized protein LOC131687580 [Topomyia yanbarensis]